MAPAPRPNTLLGLAPGQCCRALRRRQRLLHLGVVVQAHSVAARIAIEVDAKEDIQIYTPLSSRIAHLAVIDVLAIGVAQKKGPQLQQHLQQLQEGLSSLRSD